MTPAADNELTRVRRGLASRRWTAVITTSGTGLILVALAARLATAAAVAAALLVAIAIGAAVRRAATQDRQWRRVLSTTRADAAGEEPRCASST